MAGFALYMGERAESAAIVLEFRAVKGQRGR